MNKLIVDPIDSYWLFVVFASSLEYALISISLVCRLVFEARSPILEIASLAESSILSVALVHFRLYITAYKVVKLSTIGFQDAFNQLHSLSKLLIL